LIIAQKKLHDVALRSAIFRCVARTGPARDIVEAAGVAVGATGRSPYGGVVVGGGDERGYRKPWSLWKTGGDEVIERFWERYQGLPLSCLSCDFV
jgi:hypothetical protein